MAVRQAKPPRAEKKLNKIVKPKNKSDSKILIVAQEIKFAKILAGNDKKARDKVIRSVKKWLSYRSASSFEFTEEDFMRLWKGLFYCVWMSDKPLVQEDLCESISAFFECFGNDKMETSALFYKCFVKTMATNWFGIDQHRIDKFLMLVRRMTRGVLCCVERLKWAPEAISPLASSLEAILQDGPGLGLQMHIADLWMEEVAKVSRGEISPSTVAELTRPFARSLCFGQETRLAGSIMRHVFTHLIRQTDQGINYQEKLQAWKNAGYPGGSVDAMTKVEESEEDEAEEPEQDSDDDSKPPKRRRGMDPRAGHVDAVLPQLSVDGSLMAAMIKEMMEKENKSTLRNRAKLNALVHSFEVLASGQYPYKLKDLTMPNDPRFRLPKAGRAALELMAFQDMQEDDEMRGMNKRQRRKHLMKQRKLAEEEDEDDDENVLPPKQPPSKKKRESSVKTKPGVWQVEDVKQSEEIRPDSNKTLTPEKDAPKKVKNSKLERKPVAKPNIEAAEPASNSNDSSVSKKENKKPSKTTTLETPKKSTKNTSISRNNSDDVIASKKDNITPKKHPATNTDKKDTPKLLKDSNTPKKINKRSPSKDKSTDSINKSAKENTESPKQATLDTPKKLSKRNSVCDKNSSVLNISNGVTLNKTCSSITPVKTADKTKKSKDIVQNDVKIKSPNVVSSTPIHAKRGEKLKVTPEGDTEIVIPLKNQAKKLIAKDRLNSSDSGVLKSQKNRLNILKANHSLSSSPSRKKVMIALKNNTSQGVIDYFKSVKQSPEIPFDGQRKPSKTSLKPNTLPSPINPFYKKKLKLNF